MSSGVVIYAKDLHRLTTFYSSVTGVAVSHVGVGHHEVGPDLTLVAMPVALASTVEISDPPRRRDEVAIKPVFEVADIASLRVVAAELGGALNPPELEWHFRGGTVCDGHDPEGNVIQLRQRQTP